MLEDPVVEELPDTLRKVQSDVLPVLQTLADTHARVAFIAGSTERIMAFVDDTSRTFGGAARGGAARPAPPARAPTRAPARAARRPSPGRPSASTAAGSLSARNCRMRSASASSPIAPAARPRACSARRKPRLGSCDHGTGP